MTCGDGNTFPLNVSEEMFRVRTSKLSYSTRLLTLPPLAFQHHIMGHRQYIRVPSCLVTIRRR